MIIIKYNVDVGILYPNIFVILINCLLVFTIDVHVIGRSILDTESIGSCGMLIEAGISLLLNCACCWTGCWTGCWIGRWLVDGLVVVGQVGCRVSRIGCRISCRVGLVIVCCFCCFHVF